MKRRVCRTCGLEMLTELKPEGPTYYCIGGDDHTCYDEMDVEPHCPVCGNRLQFCNKCGQSYFCSTCNGIVSKGKIDWQRP